MHRHPFAVDGRAAQVLLAACQVVLHHAASLERRRHRDAALCIPALGSVAVDHRVLDVLQRGVGHLVLDVDGGAFHLGEAHAAALQESVAVGFQEGRGLLLARVDLDPVGGAADEDLGKAGVRGVDRAHVHDVGRQVGLGHGFDFSAGGVSQVDPRQVGAGGGRVDGEARAHLGHIQRAGGQILLLVCHEHEQAAVGGVVAHQHGAVVRHHLHQLVRDAAHAEVLLDAGGAVGVDRDFGHVAVEVRVGHDAGGAEQALAERQKLRVGAGREGVRLVLLAGQVGVPWRQAGAAGNPQAIDRRSVDVVVLDQGQLAGGRVLVQRQHADRGRQAAIGIRARLVPRGVLKLDHGEHRVALHAGHLGAVDLEQRGAVGRVGVKLAFLAGHRFVDDRLVVDVEVAAGEDAAALAVRDHVAGDEEGLIGQLVGLAAAVAERNLQAGAHRGGSHCSGVVQRGRRHAGELGGRKRGAGRRDGRRRRSGGGYCVAIATATDQEGGSAKAQRQHGCAGQEFKRLAAGCVRFVEHSSFPFRYVNDWAARGCAAVPRARGDNRAAFRPIRIL